jgi:DNA repair exonuclease SbcCD ATPase subunit
MTTEIDEQIKQLVIKRNQLTKQQQVENITKLDRINNEIRVSTIAIEDIDDKIKSKKNEIDELEQARKHWLRTISKLEQARKHWLRTISKLEKEKCPIIGHEWDYDWERHDEGGGLFEHCVVCGAPRMD